MTAGPLGPILVTGCSSGIGAATAHRLLAGGHLVYATARSTGALADLAAAGARVLPLDVTDTAAVTAVVEEVVGAHGRVGALVNNAGYGAYGAVEDTPLDAVVAQFETNVFGVVRMIQAVLPSMRATGAGRIVNLSSMGGRLTFPFGGYYHASKHAVEALSDALRVEVRPFGVQVSIIEPGLITTRFGATATGTLTSATPAESPYAGAARRVEQAMAASYANRRLTAGPEAVAGSVEKALTARRPRTRYVVTPAARALVTTRAVSPGRVWDRIVTRAFGL
jgi:NAD(P)-dependent dehydrogenase (short-subunit alcohol dehydrogenase family)